MRLYNWKTIPTLFKMLAKLPNSDNISILIKRSLCLSLYLFFGLHLIVLGCKKLYSWKIWINYISLICFVKLQWNQFSEKQSIKHNAIGQCLLFCVRVKLIAVSYFVKSECSSSDNIQFDSKRKSMYVTPMKSNSHCARETVWKK